MECRSVFATGFSVLLLLSAITMGGAAAFNGTPDTPGDQVPAQGTIATEDPDYPPQLNNTSISRPNITDPRLTPPQRLYLANQTLGEIEPQSNREERALERATGHIRSALDDYDRFRATDRHAFDRQARALHALARMSGGNNDGTLENVSNGIYLASNQSARIAVIDANRSLQVFEDELSRNEQRYAERAIHNARRALDRGDAAAELSESESGRHSPRRQIQALASAIDHYRSAYHHADRAMGRMERAIDPSVSISQGQALEHNGTVLVRVHAVVQDVRPTAYDTATVIDSEGGEIDTIELNQNPRSAFGVRGTTVIDVGSTLENRTITVRSTARHDSSRTVESTFEVSVSEGDVVPERTAPDEYHEVTVENGSTGVSVSAGGEGLWERDISVTNETPSNGSGPQVAPVVHIQNRSAIDSATVSIPLTEEVEPGQNASIYTWDPRSAAGWERVETEVDYQNGTATANVSHFPFFTVFTDAWEDYMSERIILEDRHFVGGENDSSNESTSNHVDLVFVVDESGSMRGDPIYFARLAAERFVGALHEDERAGLVGFSSGSTLYQSLTTDHDSLNASISSLNAGGGTDTEAGIRRAISELQQNGRDNRSQLIVLLSDGQSNSNSYPRDAAGLAAENGIQISTVGLGSNIGEEELTDVANITGGGFYHVQDAEDLPETFGRVAANRTDRQLRDTDNDGIPDAVAEANPRLPGFYGIAGHRIDIDPAVADTSGDGLLDNQTIDVQYRVFEDGNDTVLETRVTHAVADPSRYDTDGEGLSDYEEVEVWGTNAWLWDSSGDGYNDFLDPDPTEQNPSPRVTARSDNWQRYQILNVHNGQFGSVEASARFDPVMPGDDPFWKDSAGNVVYLDTVSEDTFEAIQYFYPPVTEDDDILVTFNEHGWVDEDPKRVRVTLSGDGINGQYEVDVTDDTPEFSRLAYTAPVVSTRAPHPYVIGGALVIAGIGLAVDAAHESSPTIRGEETGAGETTVAVGTILNTEIEDFWIHRDGPPIYLPSGDTYSHEPTGQERQWGEEQVLEFPGIQDSEDIGEIIEDGERLPGRGDYDLVIGDNPNGEGQVVLRLLEGMVVSAEYAKRDPVRDEWIRIPDDTVDKIANEKNDWDHNQIGNTEEEVVRNIRRIINDPDEIYKDPNQDRWMYAKRIVLNGREVIAVLFVQNGEVATAFVPTHHGYSGEAGYSDEYVKWYIQAQQMIKEYVPGEDLLPDVGIGESPPQPDQRPDPTEQ
jgi:Mg-chelatase subunit ChlD